MGPDFWREMPQRLRALDADASVRAIIVRGEGGNFSYGLDLIAMMAELGPLLVGRQAGRRAHEAARAHRRACSAPSSAVAACRKPVIAAVAGWCIGGGLDLIAACDVRLASRRRALLPARGEGGHGGRPRAACSACRASSARANTRELAFTGKDIDAARALRMGLVNEVLPDEAALLEAARATAREIAENPPLVVQGVKQVMNDCAGKSVAEGPALRGRVERRLPPVATISPRRSPPSWSAGRRSSIRRRSWTLTSVQLLPDVDVVAVRIAHRRFPHSVLGMVLHRRGQRLAGGFDLRDVVVHARGESQVASGSCSGRPPARLRPAPGRSAPAPA